MTRIDRAFAAIPTSGAPGLVTFTVAGDPDLDRSARVLEALPGAGANVVEVGVPFSDPLADGPVIQRASERALRAGATLTRVLDTLERHRARVDAPIVLFTYANPVVRMGYEEFTSRSAAAGIDGVLVVDLPPAEAEPLRAALAAREIAQIFLVSPTTPAERVRQAAALGSGFIYAISRLGVTGARDALSNDAHDVVALVRRESKLPVALGFGISTPEQVRAACRVAHAAVVGSAIVQTIGQTGCAPDLVERVVTQVRSLKGAA
jgi:tryptophan synthase alpha chain